jgi:hypothetical protein
MLLEFYYSYYIAPSLLVWAVGRRRRRRRRRISGAAMFILQHYIKMLVGWELGHRGTHRLKHGVPHRRTHPVHGVGDASVNWVHYQRNG